MNKVVGEIVVDPITMLNNKEKEFGICSRCGTPLVPVWFTEKEQIVKDGIMYYTGRKRRACSHLTCPECLKNEVVDDSFDGGWY